MSSGWMRQLGKDGEGGGGYVCLKFLIPDYIDLFLCGCHSHLITFGVDLIIFTQIFGRLVRSDENLI